MLRMPLPVVLCQNVNRELSALWHCVCIAYIVVHQVTQAFMTVVSGNFTYLLDPI